MNATQRKRRMLSLSLRMFIVLVTVGCVWFAWSANRAHRQRRAVEWIYEAGGRIRYDFEFREDGRSITNAEPPGPDWLREWIGIDYFATVSSVQMGRTGVSDLSPLSNLTSLEHLTLIDSQVTDLTPLAEMTSLRSMDLTHTPVSDLSPLSKRLNNLISLTLTGTKVSDVAPLASLPNLVHLNLNGTPAIRTCYRAASVTWTLVI